MSRARPALVLLILEVALLAAYLIRWVITGRQSPWVIAILLAASCVTTMWGTPRRS